MKLNKVVLFFFSFVVICVILPSARCGITMFTFYFCLEPFQPIATLNDNLKIAFLFLIKSYKQENNLDEKMQDFVLNFETAKQNL